MKCTCRLDIIKAPFIKKKTKIEKQINKGLYKKHSGYIDVISLYFFLIIHNILTHNSRIIFWIHRSKWFYFTLLYLKIKIKIMGSFIPEIIVPRLTWLFFTGRVWRG